MTDQLRIYKLHPGALDDFLEVWRSQVVPLRRRMGFEVRAAWTKPEDDRFVWVVGYEGEDGFEAAEQRYYASPERDAISPNPSSFVASAETMLLERYEPI